MKSVIRFSEVLDADLETDNFCTLLQAMEKRSYELDDVDIAEKPVKHADMMFKEVRDADFLQKVSERIRVAQLFRRQAREELQRRIIK